VYRLKISERSKIVTHSTHIIHHSLSWLGTGTSKIVMDPRLPNVNNEFILDYGKPRKSDVFFDIGKNKQKI
jgi:hypothetical protein